MRSNRSRKNSDGWDGEPKKVKRREKLSEDEISMDERANCWSRVLAKKLRTGDHSARELFPVFFLKKVRVPRVLSHKAYRFLPINQAQFHSQTIKPLVHFNLRVHHHLPFSFWPSLDELAPFTTLNQSFFDPQPQPTALYYHHHIFWNSSSRIWTSGADPTDPRPPSQSAPTQSSRYKSIFQIYRSKSVPVSI